MARVPGKVVMPIPVYLPGKDRDDWTHVIADGVATITDDGNINITLKEPSQAMALVDFTNNSGQLVCVGFDYIPAKKEN